MTDKEAINGLQNIVEYWTLNPHEQEVAQHAILALQEREERDKGCDWCSGICSLRQVLADFECIERANDAE